MFNIHEDYALWKKINEMAIYYGEDEERKLNFFNYLRDMIRYNKGFLVRKIVCPILGHKFIECSVGGIDSITRRLCMKCGATK